MSLSWTKHTHIYTFKMFSLFVGAHISWLALDTKRLHFSQFLKRISPKSYFSFIHILWSACLARYICIFWRGTVKDDFPHKKRLDLHVRSCTLRHFPWKLIHASANALLTIFPLIWRTKCQICPFRISSPMRPGQNSGRWLTWNICNGFLSITNSWLLSIEYW